MKKIIIILCLLLCYTTEIQAQSQHKKIKQYRVWITLMDSPKSNAIKGILYSADEDFVTFKYKISDEYSVNTIDPNIIKKIEIRRKGKVGKGAVIGAVTGLGIGAIAGYSEGDDFLFSKETKAIFGGIAVGGFFGAPMGALLTTGKKKFEINGDIENYKRHLKSLQKYTIMPTN